MGTLPIFLGGNGAGINNSSMSDSEFGYMFSRGVSSIANGKDPANPSPHSGYTCVIGCGDQGLTPAKLDQYLGTTNHYLDDGSTNYQSLQDYYKTIKVNPDFARFAPEQEKNK